MKKLMLLFIVFVFTNSNAQETWVVEMPAPANKVQIIVEKDALKYAKRNLSSINFLIENPGEKIKLANRTNKLKQFKLLNFSQVREINSSFLYFDKNSESIRYEETSRVVETFAWMFFLPLVAIFLMRRVMKKLSKGKLNESFEDMLAFGASVISITISFIAVIPAIYAFCVLVSGGWDIWSKKGLYLYYYSPLLVMLVYKSIAW